MAFYSGSANSFADLQTALVNACVAEGWTWSNGILSKGTAFVKPWVELAATASTGIGLVLQGGTGQSGTTLVTPSPQTPRMGPPSRDTSHPAWPMAYSLHIFDAPYEVFLVANYSVDYFMFCAFGLSTVPGLGASGLWLSATSRRFRGPTGPGILISATSSGGVGADSEGAASSSSSGGFLWTETTSGAGSGFTVGSMASAICSGLDGVLWPYPTLLDGSFAALNTYHANVPAAPHLGRSPSAWNQESPLLPIQCTLVRASSKVSLVADIRNARYVRVDNYAPGQIITLGSDRWKIYPFYRKSIAGRDGSTLPTAIDHTGTFGWAIRYDGP